MHNHSLTDGPTGTPVHPHPVALRHSALGAALCLLFSLLTLFAVSLFFSGFTIPINRDLSGFVNGFYPTEGDYTWTEGTATIHLSGLNRHSAWKCQLIFSSACPIQDQLPFVTIMIDGHPSLKVRASNAIQMIDIPISPNAQSSDLLLTLSSSPIFVPSSQDTRALGVMIRGIRFTCEGIPWLPGRQLILALLIFSLIFGAFLGYTLRSAASIAFFSLLAGSGYVSLISYSVARYYPPFLWHSAVIAVSIASLLSVAVFCRHVFRCELTMMDRYALVSVAIVASIEIAVLLHPHKPDMDDTMHVHRFLAVQSGNYFLTETAPGGYVSPRAIGFYVFVMLFRGMTADIKSLMQVMTVLIFSLAALAIHLMIKKSTKDDVWAFSSCVAYLLCPVMMNMLGRGCFAHLFAYHLIIFALLFIIFMSSRYALFSGIAAGAFIAASFLSHLAALMACLPLFLIIACLLWWSSRPDRRTLALSILAAVFIAVGLSYALYYSHFSDLYQAQMMKAYHAMSSPAPSNPQEDYHPRESSELTPYAPGGRSIVIRAMSVPHYMLQAYGLPLLLMAACGLYFVTKSYQSGDLVSAIACAWMIGSAGLIVLSVASPLDTRPYMIMAFSMVCMSGRAVSLMLKRHVLWRVVVFVAVIAQIYFAAQASWVWLN